MACWGVLNHSKDSNEHCQQPSQLVAGRHGETVKEMAETCNSKVAAEMVKEVVETYNNKVVVGKETVEAEICNNKLMEAEKAKEVVETCTLARGMGMAEGIGSDVGSPW